jgi:predicted Abi (CAAX) family protease
MISTVLTWQVSRPASLGNSKAQIDTTLPRFILTITLTTQFLLTRVMALLGLGSATDWALLGNGVLASVATCSHS